MGDRLLGILSFSVFSASSLRLTRLPERVNSINGFAYCMDFILFLACNQRENGLYYSRKSDKHHTNHTNNTAARYGRTGGGTT